MAQRLTRKEMKQDQFVEAAFDLGEWLEEHWKPVAAALVGVVVLALAYVGWAAWNRSSAEKAGRLLSEGIRAYQGGEATPSDPQAALASFEQAAAAAPRSGAGRAAAYYRGAVLLALGRTDEAVAALEGAASRATEPVLQGTAHGLLAEAYLKAGRAEEAAATWRRLAEGSAGAFPADQARLGLARALLAQGKTDEARATLERLAREAPQSSAAGEAFRLLQQSGTL